MTGNEGRKKKPDYVFFALLFLFFIYLGYVIGTLDRHMLRLENIADSVTYALRHPLPFRTTETTMGCIGVAVLAWLLVFVKYVSGLKNYMAGEEYGTARWAKPEEVNKQLENKKEPHENKIFSEHLRMSLSDRDTGLNNNVVILGGSGAGKSFRFVKPNGYQLSKTSYIYTDPKGELLRDIGGFLRENGYTVKVLNLVDMESSDGYNPFAYIRNEGDVDKLITNLIANTTDKNATKGDPFWEKSESLYLQSLMLYEWMESPKQNKIPSFRGVMELLSKAKIPEDENELSELDEIMYSLEETHPALLAYNKVRRGAVDTVRTIIISANSRLVYMQNEKLLRLLDHDDIDIPSLGVGVHGNKNKKTALFCVIPVTDKSYNFVVGMLYTCAHKGGSFAARG